MLSDRIRTALERVLNPDREFAPIPFWFLNDELTDEELVRQLHEFHAKGVGGVVLHPRIGMPKSIPYLSDVFFHYMTLAVKTAASLDMKIVLYDEAMYPSGSAHGMVVAEDPRHAAQAIILADTPDEGKLIAQTASGKYIVQVASGGTIRGIHFGEDDGEAEAPPAADLLSQASVDTFIRLTHERYYAELGAYFGTTIIGFFTDEPSLLGRKARKHCKPWTWGFEDEFCAHGGDLAALEDLFTGVENENTRLYERAIFEREQRIYYQSLHRFCQTHGIALMGHPHRGDDIECEALFDIPGQDIVWRWYGPELDPLAGTESAQGKCSADAARNFGRRRNSNECFGVCVQNNIPWYFTGADMKWYLDNLAVRGVNMFIPHAFFYSIRDGRCDERPPDVGPNNIWWPHYESIAAYIRRISYLMTDAVNEAKVCVLCANREMHVEKVRDFYTHQVEFNYLPYADLRAEMVQGNQLVVGENVYDHVYCDDRNALPSVPQIRGIGDLPYRDLYTAVPCLGLRVSRLKKDGVRMIFLTNEGNTPIETDAAIDGETTLVAVDLWSGEVWREDCHANDGKTQFRLSLGVRESLLLLLDEHNEFSAPSKSPRTYVNVALTEIADDTERFVKTYRGTFTLTQQTADPLWLRVYGEEMVECFVNGQFVGFSLWNAHEFCLSDALHVGENEILLSVTGSAANRFTDHRIPYGLQPL